MLTEEQIQRELELENEMVGLGAKRYQDAVLSAREHGREGSTDYGTYVIKLLLDPLAKGIQAFVDYAYTGKPGPKMVSAKAMRDIDAEVLAYLVLKASLNAISKEVPIQTVAKDIATAIETEARFTHWEKVAKKGWKQAHNKITHQTSSPVHQRRFLIMMMNRDAKELPELAWEPWTDKDRLHIGIKAVDILIESTGMFRYSVVFRGAKKSESILSGTPELTKLMQDRSAFCSLLQPVYLPTIIPPKRWTNPFNGGYHSRAVRRLSLVKTRNKNYLEELANMVPQMPAVYAAINHVQNTPWKINTGVLDVMRQVWESGLVISGLPAREDIPLPPKPADIADNKESRGAWKKAAAKVHQKNIQTTSKRLRAAQILWVADKYRDEPALYFPMQLDFRGRMYAVPSFLNPQGCDASKGLLTFAEGKPLDEKAWRWLKIHGANVFGKDKCSMDERVKWVEDNHEQILRVARDPIGEVSWWSSADKPWQFLAFCLDYGNVCKPGSLRISSLPVSVDGACNGLQHFSAMLRDEVGGAAVNLIPSSQPQDIYQRVADVVIKKVAHDVEQQREFAQDWMDLGISRKVTKRPVMVLPYGGTQYSSRYFVMDHMKEVQEEGKELPWGDSFPHAAYLAGHIWSSIGDVVIAARAAMSWLQAAASVVCDEEIPITWTTPVGFPVIQAYPNMKSVRVKTKIAGSVVKLVNSEEDFNTLDSRRQCNGISPNFVHSLDACCLMLSVNKAVAGGITNFAMVHDSYGTVAADMETLAVSLREAFCEMYRTDVLAEFQASIMAGLSPKRAEGLPPLPQKGALNIEAVKDSEYFFA